MLIDLRPGPDEGPWSAETLIVGSGAVGLTMAIELARAGRQVILLEAAGLGIDAASQEHFTSARWRARRLHGLHLGRLRLLVGTTNFCRGQLVEVDTIIFAR